MRNSTAILFTYFLFLTFLGASCKKQLQGESYDPAGSTDTDTKEIKYQISRTWRMDNGDISVSNTFTGARLNEFRHLQDSLYEAVIEPENAPVNKSPWYAFSIWASEPRKIAVRMNYFEDYSHRYYPDISTDLKSWSALDSSRFVEDTVKNEVTLLLDIGPDTLFVSAQEILTSNDVYNMVNTLEQADNIQSEIIGFSRLGKPIPVVKMGNPASKQVLVVLGRQHPPETTGYLALKSFINRISAQDELSTAFLNKYQVLLFPIVNPDGVDLGHWRHNAGGIDLNRDWQYFKQPETASIRDYIVEFMSSGDKEIIFEIDFHSTQEDLFYVFNPDQPSSLTGFTHQWLDSIESNLDWYVADRVPTSGNSPVSTQWFYSNYNTEAVTYEVGDDSPREAIREISSTAATAMMEILLSI